MAGMRFQLETAAGLNVVRACNAGVVRVGDQDIRTSFILTADRIVAPWEAPAADRLTIDDLAPVLALEAEVILLGTGDTSVIPPARLRAGVNSRNIAMSKDGKHLAVANFLPHSLTILSTADLSVEKIFDVKGKDGETSRVSAVYQAPHRDSFILALKDIPEIWEEYAIDTAAACRTFNILVSEDRRVAAALLLR